MPTRYHAAIRAARDTGLQLSAEQQARLVALLEEYAREIERRAAAGLARRTDAAVLREVSAILDAMAVDLATATGEAVRLTARQIAEIQARATLELVTAAGVDVAVAAAFGMTGARAAQAVLARPELAEAFVTIRRVSAQAANRIIARGRLRGAPPTAIAKELRQYIALPGSALEGQGTLLADRRRIGYAAIEQLGYEPTPENLALVRSEASQIAYRAARIARTETANAQSEALIQGAIDSPVVAFVQWALSARHTEPCACEPIAELDLYGHGPGLYDPRCVPIRPHPHCLCLLTHVLRSRDQWGQERGPVPDLAVSLEHEAEATGLPPSAQAAFVRAVETGRARTLEPVGV